MRTPEFPKTIPRGSLSVTIYKTPNKGYSSYTLVYYQDGRRKREAGTDYSAMLNRADEVLDDLENARPAVEGAMKATDRAEFTRGKATLARHGIKLPLDVVASHYAQAVKFCGDMVIEAAREYGKRHPAKMPQKTVVEVVDEFIEVRREKGRRGAKGGSARYVEDLVYRLGQFKEFAKGNISHVDGDQFRLFLDSLTKADGKTKVSARSYNNFRLTLITLFEWAKGRKYLPSDWSEFDGVEKMVSNGGPIEIFTPDEMSKLLAAAGPEEAPFLAIGAFSGVRSAEIMRLDWQDVKFETGFVIVEKGKAKTASRRQVELKPNLRGWLQKYAKKQGRVYPHSEDCFYRALRELSVKAKVPWKNNALRHSYVSYRVAETNDVNRTSLEAGNSPAKIFSNYRELVTPQQAADWFSIVPPRRRSKRSSEVTP